MNKVMDKILNNDKSIYLVIAISLLVFLAVAFSASYAFYAMQVLGNEDSNGITLRSPDVAIIYENNQNIILDRIQPGYTGEMNFSISNVSDVEGDWGAYKIVWQISTNNISSNDFVYSLSSRSIKDGKEVPSSKTNKVVSIPDNLRIPSISSTIGEGIIDAGITHEYTLTIKFIDTNVPQDELRDKQFDGKIIVEGM